MRVEKSWNPLVMDYEPVVIDVAPGLSPNQMIDRQLVVFDRPTMLMVDGEFWSRKDWDLPVPAGAMCRFVELPRGGGGGSNPLRIIGMIAVMALAFYVPGALGLYGLTGSLVSAAIMIGGSMLLNMLFPVSPIKTTAIGAPNSMYSLAAGGNRLRIGEPYAEHFGRFICYPDLVQVSYTSIENNDQYLYFLGIIGIGEFAIEAVNIDKTPMLDYMEASYTILPPGVPPSLVPNLVWTSMAVTGQDITTDWFTARVSAPGTNLNYIEYDVFFQSLTASNSGGGLVSTSVEIVTEARRIDATGSPLGDWLPLRTFTYTAASKDPLRFSEKCPVPDGVGGYEFRINRTTAVSTNPQISDRASCIGLRGYGGRHPEYTGCTLIEAKIKATDQLSGDVGSRINVIATRKLYPVEQSGFGYDLVATRSIVDFCAYAVTSSNGGNQPASGLMFDVLYDMRNLLEDCGYYFDWRFTSRLSVMDACAKAAQCGRSFPYMPSGMFALVRDDYRELPSITYTDDDFDEGSLSITNVFTTADSPTCMRMSYTNQSSWQLETVSCYDEGGSELSPKDISLEGCTSRQAAYEIGMFLYRDYWYNRTTVEFTTGLKGHLPSLFSKALIGAASIDWGQSGKIAAIEEGVIWTSEPIDFKGDSGGKMYITAANGDTEGPFAVYPVPGVLHCVSGAIDRVKTIQDDDVMATSYLFGPVSVDPLFIRVMTIQPQGRNRIKVTGNTVNDLVYSDPGVAPEISTGIPLDDPLVSVSLFYVEGGNFSLSWVGSATTFKIEKNEGTGYTLVQDNYGGYSVTASSTFESVTFRVTPYVEGVAAPEYAQTISYNVVPAPLNVELTYADATEIVVSWDPVSGATYRASLYVAGGLVEGLNSEDPTVTLTVAQMQAIGGPWPVFSIRVSAIVGGVMSSETALDISMAIPGAPTGLALQSVLSGGFLISWNYVAGATGYVVYRGGSSGFVPAVDGELAFSVTGGGSVSGVAALSTSSPYTYYFKVAAVDAYYHNVADLNFGTALTVSG